MNPKEAYSGIVPYEPMPMRRNVVVLLYPTAPGTSGEVIVAFRNGSAPTNISIGYGQHFALFPLDGRIVSWVALVSGVVSYYVTERDLARAFLSTAASPGGVTDSVSAVDEEIPVSYGSIATLLTNPVDSGLIYEIHAWEFLIKNEGVLQTLYLDLGILDTVGGFIPFATQSGTTINSLTTVYYAVSAFSTLTTNSNSSLIILPITRPIRLYPGESIVAQGFVSLGPCYLSSALDYAIYQLGD